MPDGEDRRPGPADRPTDQPVIQANVKGLERTIRKVYDKDSRDDHDVEGCHIQVEEPRKWSIEAKDNAKDVILWVCGPDADDNYRKAYEFEPSVGNTYREFRHFQDHLFFCVFKRTASDLVPIQGVQGVLDFHQDSADLATMTWTTSGWVLAVTLRCIGL